mmetsp:Transcript_71981/g.204083  ORF Transcript_71981/g.204083 Transcript_71981/m.204083 type:complete len:527 (+) Transcript_71981:419-1999(+)
MGRPGTIMSRRRVRTLPPHHYYCHYFHHTRWDVPTLGETQVRQLLAMLNTLEGSFDRQNTQTRTLVERQMELMDAEQVRRVVHCRLGARGPEPNPCVWQRTNLPLVEAQLLRQRVRYVRPDGGAHKLVPDRFGFGCGFSAYHYVGTQGSKRGNVDVDIVVVEMPKAGSQAGSYADRMWRTYDAHRQLSLGRCLPHVYGVDDSAEDATRFYFEYSQSRAASTLLSRAARRRSGAVLGESSATFKHWIAEILKAMIELHTMSGYECVTRARLLTLDNIFISNEGSVVKLGQLAWGRRIDGTSVPILRATAERNAALLQSFADIVDDLLLTAAGAEEAASDGGDGGGTAAVKVFHEADAAAGVYVSPGDVFEVMLACPARRSVLWHYPEVVTPSRGTEANPYERGQPARLLGGEVGHTVPRDTDDTTCRVRFVAQRAGRCELQFPCFSPQDKGAVGASLIVPVVVHAARVSPTLTAILRCCRARVSETSEQDAAVFPLSIVSLATHDYFTQGPEPSLDEVMSAYTAHFA